MAASADPQYQAYYGNFASFAGDGSLIILKQVKAVRLGDRGGLDTAVPVVMIIGETNTHLRFTFDGRNVGEIEKKFVRINK